MTRSLPPKSLVLYADDDADDRLLITEIFADYASAVELRCFTDGEPLLQHLLSLDPFAPRPCLVILDINMARLGGKEVLRRLRQTAGFEDLPVVLFSTSTLPSEQKFAQAFGAGFVTKPLYLGQVGQIIEEMLLHCSPELRDRIRNQR